MRQRLSIEESSLKVSWSLYKMPVMDCPSRTLVRSQKSFWSGCRTVEANQSQTKSQADPDRITQSALPFDASSLPPVTGFSLIILMVLIAVATFASEDLASIGAGLMVARGTFGWDQALLAVFIGILAGDIGLYLAGRLLGRRVVTLPPLLLVR